jgi:transcription elongation factor Elf1
MGNFKYITNRTLLNKAGEEAGRVRVMVKSGSDKAEGDYTCPECDHKGKVDQIFKRPFTVKCDSCGVTMRLPKLKGKK